MATIKGIDITVLGLKKLDRKLAMLPIAIQKKVIRKAMRDVAKDIILPSIKARVPVDTGLLKRNLKVRAIKRSRERIGVFVRTPTRDEMGIDPDGKWYYPGIIEYGDPKRGIKAVPYMREGFSSVEEKAKRRLGKEIGRGVIKVALTGI